MPVPRQPDSSATSEVVVRDYAEGDYGACRSLWAELTEHHRSICGDPFDRRRPDRVARPGYERRSRAGRRRRGSRDQGIGRMLTGRVVEQARARGYEYLAIRPVARNVAAVRRFHAAGFRG